MYYLLIRCMAAFKIYLKNERKNRLYSLNPFHPEVTTNFDEVTLLLDPALSLTRSRIVRNQCSNPSSYATSSRIKVEQQRRYTKLKERLASKNSSTTYSVCQRNFSLDSCLSFCRSPNYST